MIIFLDMDGVLVDFVGGVAKAHGVTNPYDANPLGMAAGYWEMADLLGITEEEFWRPLRGAEFWENLEFTPDGHEILSIAEHAAGQENVCLLTSPCDDPQSAAGKMAWIARNMPGYRDQFLMGSGKHFAAKWGAVLIDDRDSNVYSFRNSGGEAILVPRPWNSRWRERMDAVAITRNEMEDGR